ncbi:MAG: hypothetical protein PUE83_12505 [Lachnobacterium sp.]|nr:hypothetical protein [Lachnobacterium sp.]
MRKIISNILPALALALILIMPGDKTMAGTIASIDAGVKDGTVTVSGTADSGVLSVAIFVYDEAGENMLQMKSVAVASDQKYSEDFKLSDGKYLVKAADYDGGKFAETTVTVGESKEDDKNKDNQNPGSQNPDNKDQDNTKPGDTKPSDTKLNDTAASVPNVEQTAQPADSVSAAKTGDTTNIMMPVLALLIGMGGVCIFVGRRGVKNSK